MATYYVGSGGNDASAGTSWGARKLTLGGAEAIPVAAGDTVYVGPGVYRELLTVAVSGTNGNPITYIADVSGANTDGIGGIVRITGSDNDQANTRSQCVTLTSFNYRTFRGFALDGGSADLFHLVSPSNVIIEDCFLQATANIHCVNVSGASQAAVTVRRCQIVTGYGGSACQFAHSANVSDVAHVVENCVLLGVHNTSIIYDEHIGGITIRNCVIRGGYGVDLGILPAAGQTITVNNCVLCGNTTALNGNTSGYIVENYNTFNANSTNRVNVATGANSVTYPPLFDMPVLRAGFIHWPWRAFALSEWSQVRAITGTGTPTDDLLGVTRPTTAGKLSWGPLQWNDVSQSTTQVHAGTYALKLADAGRVQWVVPTTAVSTTITVYVYREANYAGTNPQLVIKQPGQSDITATDAGASGGWNQLSSGAFTPAASPPYVVVEVVSNNTATSGSYNTYVDDLAVA